MQDKLLDFCCHLNTYEGFEEARFDFMMLDFLQENPDWPFTRTADKLPDHENNVLAILDGKVCVMAYDHILQFWGIVHNGLDGDAELDDVYEPTHWMEIPGVPESIKNENHVRN